MLNELPPEEPVQEKHHRRRLTAPVPKEMPDAAAKRSLLAFAGVGALGIWGMFATLAPLAVLHGGLIFGLGLLLVLLPPRFRVGSGWWLLGGLFLAGCSLAFLPASWFTKPGWRTDLEKMGVDLGSMVTTQPRLSLELLAGLLVSVIVTLYLLGHRIPGRGQKAVVLGLALGIAGYTVSAILLQAKVWTWDWDRMNTFGLFANRNHTATLLTMGALCGLGLLMQAVRSRHGGWSGLAALVLALCLAGLLGFSPSRAGVLLLVLGTVLWLAGLALRGTGYISRRMAVVVLAFTLVGGGVFWWSGNALQNRLEDSLFREAAGPTASEEGNAAALADNPTDFRVLIYRDTLDMIRHEPLTGAGLGQFAGIFPQYRNQAMVNSKCWHPESNWLALAAEAGWGTVAVLAVALAALFWKGFSGARTRRGWPLCWATLLAAAIVPVHGLFDMPAYHVGIAWPALVLLMMNFRQDEPGLRTLGGWGKTLFRLLGLGLMAGGGWVLAQPLLTGSPPAMLESTLAQQQIKHLYARDLAQQADPVASPPEMGPDGKPVDQLEKAQKIVAQSLINYPLDPELYYLSGMLALNFEEEGALAEKSFAIQRRLEPDWPDVPFRQGIAWLNRDPGQSLALWQEVFLRTRAGDKIRPKVFGYPANWMYRMKRAIPANPPDPAAMKDLVLKLEEDSKQP